LQLATKDLNEQLILLREKNRIIELQITENLKLAFENEKNQLTNQIQMLQKEITHIEQEKTKLSKMQC
jgi:hypothetical protein